MTQHHHFQFNTQNKNVYAQFFVIFINLSWGFLSTFVHHFKWFHKVRTGRHPTVKNRGGNGLRSEGELAMHLLKQTVWLGEISCLGARWNWTKCLKNKIENGTTFMINHWWTGDNGCLLHSVLHCFVWFIKATSHLLTFPSICVKNKLPKNLALTWPGNIYQLEMFILTWTMERGRVFCL